MKCSYCGTELSEPVAEIHIKNKWCVKEKDNEKVIEKTAKVGEDRGAIKQSKK